MARRVRCHIPGAFYHVMLRGNNGQNIFHNDDERRRMCTLIDEGIGKYHHRIHAFCLMSNHVHLLVQVGNTPLSMIMHNLTFRYCQYFHWRHKTFGHLFQGRYKAILLQEEGYFKRLLRYIHMNPVNANLVQDPESYPWSGHRVYLNEGEFPWLTTHYGLKKFGDTIEEARTRYCNFILQQNLEEDLKELQEALEGDQILGDDTFRANILGIEKMDFKLSKEILLQAACQAYEVEEAELTSTARSEKFTLIRGAVVTFARKQGFTIEDMADLLKRDRSVLGKSMRQFSEKCANDPETQQRYEQIEELIHCSLEL
jgi:putative transposase